MVTNVVPINRSVGENMSNQAAKKEGKKPTMLTDTDKIIIREVPLGKILKGKDFDSFESLRRKSNKVLGQLRIDWMNYLFMKNGIYINYSDLTKREVIEIYEANGLTVINQNGIDRVFKYSQLLGEWSRERKLYFDKEGQLIMEVKYSVL